MAQKISKVHVQNKTQALHFRKSVRLPLICLFYLCIEDNDIKLDKMVYSQKVDRKGRGDRERQASSVLAHVLGEKQRQPKAVRQQRAGLRSAGANLGDHTCMTGLQWPDRICRGWSSSLMIKRNRKTFDDKKYKTQAVWKIEQCISDR